MYVFTYILIHDKIQKENQIIIINKLPSTLKIIYYKDVVDIIVFTIMLNAIYNEGYLIA